MFVFSYFFDYTDSEHFEALKPFSGTFSLLHIFFLVLVVLSVVILGIYIRKKGISKPTVIKIIKISLLFWIPCDLFKLLWIYCQSGLTEMLKNLPFFLCSMILYVMPLVVWGKGKIRSLAIANLATFTLLGGGAGSLIPEALKLYPFFSFGALRSLFYHWNMVFIGFLVLFTQLEPINHKTVPKGFISTLFFACIAIIANAILDTDYFLLNDGRNTIFEVLGTNLSKPLFILVMLAFYYGSCTVLVEGKIIISKLIDRPKKQAEVLKNGQA